MEKLEMLDKSSMFVRWADNLERNAKLVECVRNGIIDYPFETQERIKLLLVRLDYVIEDLVSVAYLIRLEAEKCNRQNR